MNLLDAVVTKVLGREEVTWDIGEFVLIEVEYDCWGRLSTTKLVFKKGEEPDVQPGYEFLT